MLKSLILGCVIATPFVSISPAQAAWCGWDKFWKSIDPTNPKTWEDLGDSIADVCHWGPGQSWLPKSSDGATVYCGWNASQMPFAWQNLNHAWQNPHDYSGMMVIREDVWVVSHDYIPHVAKVESHSQICIELKDAVDTMQPHKDDMLMTIHSTVAQMEEEGCQNIPDWAKNTSKNALNLLNNIANTDWSKVKWDF